MLRFMHFCFKKQMLFLLWHCFRNNAFALTYLDDLVQCRCEGLIVKIREDVVDPIVFEEILLNKANV